jgi:hypothetical protein
MQKQIHRNLPCLNPKLAGRGNGTGTFAKAATVPVRLAALVKLAAIHNGNKTVAPIAKVGKLTPTKPAIKPQKQPLKGQPPAKAGQSLGELLLSRVSSNLKKSWDGSDIRKSATLRIGLKG